MESKKKDEYTFGQCKFCLKQAALKNGLCVECQQKERNNPSFADWFEDLINKKKWKGSIGNGKKENFYENEDIKINPKWMMHLEKGAKITNGAVVIIIFYAFLFLVGIMVGTGLM